MWKSTRFAATYARFFCSWFAGLIYERLPSGILREMCFTRLFVFSFFVDNLSFFCIMGRYYSLFLQSFISYIFYTFMFLLRYGFIFHVDLSFVFVICLIYLLCQLILCNLQICFLTDSILVHACGVT